ncbi:MAG: ACP phosphodiesterase [Opitutales bacterium]|nr:ACP phosphodiesterase [Opitutales bacterium]
MNYIAHAHFSDSFDLFMTGQLLGDFATNSILEGCDHELIRGVQAHRELDHFTDTHPSFLAGCKILEESAQRYAPVVMDILIDHVLVSRWSFFHREDYFSFLDKLYEALRFHAEVLPERMARPAKSMYSHDWFSRFGTSEGLEALLIRLSSRVRRPEWIDATIDCVPQLITEVEPHASDLLKDEGLLKYSKNGF